MADMNTNDFILISNEDKPIRADAVRNRDSLLQAATTLFDKHGVECVTMSAIAKAAGVGKGTLYRHFNDKADLCHALLDEDMRTFQQQTLEHLRESDSALAQLRWFVAEGAHYVVKHSELLREAALQGGLASLQHPAHLWWRQTIQALLERVQPNGDTAYMADTLYLMLDVRTIRFQRRALNYDVPRIVAGLHLLLDKFAGESGG